MRLDDFIKENLGKFNNEEPPQGHEMRFKNKLNKGKKQKVRKIIYSLMSAAAILIIAFVLVNDFKSVQPTCVLTAEMQETRDYYTSVINENASEIETLLANVDEGMKLEILTDVNSIKATDLSDFCNNSEEAVGIMVNYYNSKIETLQNIITILKS